MAPVKPAEVSWRRELLAGVSAALPIYPGVALIGLTYGASARAAGAPLEIIVASSALVFSGAAQVTWLALWQRGALAPEILLATAVLGLRHTLMAAALLPYLRGTPRLGRAALAFVLLDESFAVAIGRFVEGRDARLLLAGAGGGLYLIWQAVTILGAILGAQAPDPAALGLDLAFPLLFLGLTAPLLASRSHAVAAVMAAATVVALSGVLGSSWAVLLGACLAAVSGSALAARSRPAKALRRGR
ncbi:MAG: AzlC family ABC transporter permease [Chloroflexi bacterium]|nr:AzlC family ABC transporter permease [Chloroflexota bacterium]